MRPPEDQVLLRDMLDYARRAVAAVADKDRSSLDSDVILAAALERFSEVVGEAASKISAGTQASAPQDPWGEIIGMRNRLVHGHASMDHDLVWDVVADDLAAIIRSLEALLADSGSVDQAMSRGAKRYAAFLSYSHRYRPWVEAFHRDLEAGLKKHHVTRPVFLDDRGLRPGEP